MYGTQTEFDAVNDNLEFENDVKMYGTQTEVEAYCGEITV